MNKYDIVFVDIDDTLNPSNEPVSEYTKQVMTKLKENGIKVVVNTGRSATYAINKSKEANLSEYVISSNGSEVYNYEKKESEPGQTDFAEISKEYDKRYPMTLSSYKSQQLADILENYGKEATMFAIRESLTANAMKPIEYIRSVAMNYSRKKENGQKTEPKRESLEEIGKRIKAETEKARAEGKSMTPDEMKQKVIEEMKRKGMKIVGNSTPA
jgi:HAD superfamily hydrolase (TIGR01484 family)